MRTLLEDDLQFEDIEKLILDDKVDNFETLEYLMTRLVTQRTTKLYQMFKDIKSAYFNSIMAMRDDLLHKIRA